MFSTVANWHWTEALMFWIGFFGLLMSVMFLTTTRGEK